MYKLCQGYSNIIFIGLGIMSFFGGYTLTVYSAILPLMDENTDNPINDIVLYSVLNNTDIVETYLNNLLFSQKNTNIHSYFNYAKDSYYLGLPEGAPGHDIPLSRDAITEIIETEVEEESIILDETIVNKLTATLAILPFLYEDRQLDRNTGEIINHPTGIPARPETLLGVYLNSVDLSEDGTVALVEYYLRYAGVLGCFGYFIEEVPIDIEANIGNFYVIANYTTVAEPGVLKWWYYDIESGVYPDIGVLYEQAVQANSFMPVVPIRYDNVDLTAGDAVNTDLYKTSKKLLTKTGISIDMIADQLNANPDIDYIDHAYITHGVEPMTDHVPSLYYLGAFFDNLATSAKYSKWTYIEARENGDHPDDNQYSFIDPDIRRAHSYVNLLEHNLDVSLSFSYIDAKTIRGAIGDVRHATQEYYEKDIMYFDGWGETYKETHYILRYQTSELAYREIDIVNLSYRNQIYHNAAYVLNPDDKGFFVPIHYGICSTLPKKMQDEIYVKTLSIVINTFDKERIPWYSQGWFLVVKIIVAIVLTIFQQYWVWGTMAFEITTTAITIMEFATALVVSLAISVVFKYVASMLGPEYAGLMAVVTFVAAAALSFGGVDIGSFMGIPTAQIMLQASSVMMSASGEMIQALIQEITEDTADFMLKAKEELEGLKDKLLELLAPMDVNEMFLRRASLGSLQETPSQMYFRTVHAGNIGVNVYDTIPNYVDYALNSHKLNYGS